MISRIDLHIHSTASDGEYAPAEIVEMACSLGLEVIAITDHDTVGGIDEAMEAAQRSGLEVIPGVEINAKSKDQSIHILGYYIDHRNESLLAELTKLCHSREWRARRVLEELAALRMPLKWDRLLEIAGGSLIGRPHIAEAMVEQGYVSTIREAFDDYLGRGRPGYVQRPRLAPEEAIELISSAGGVPVLAHPLGVLPILPGLLSAGLAGLETYYSGYSVEDSRVIASEARRHGLIATGGSDYHGPSVTPGIGLGQVSVPAVVMKELRARHLALINKG
ncbi:MAG: PHP domain-containing protein [Chloroflexota bacterium]|nr:PHP domain-containing protein [Anaerolineae bacterium]